MALSAYIKSKTELKKYILESLGFPVVNIEVTDRQIENKINQTVDRYVEFGEGGLELRFRELLLNASIQDYDLGFEVFSVVKVFNFSQIHLDAVFPDKLITDFYGASTRRNDLLTLEISRQYLETLDFHLRVALDHDFNPVTRILHLHEVVTANNPIQKIGILLYERVDYSDETSLVYDHPWIKKYATALTKKQWGDNLTKYSGSVLPTGLIMDPASILAEAKEEITALDDELENVYRFPADFFIG